MELVYTDTFECPLCQVPQHFRVFGFAEPVEPKEREKAVGLAKHYHWCDIHRVCAKCGQYVRSNELELAVNNGRIPIHEAYTDDEYHEIQVAISAICSSFTGGACPANELIVSSVM